MNRAAMERLRGAGKQPLCILAGFDGFVDTIVCPVKETREEGNSHFSTIQEFGAYLMGKAGKSCSLLLEIKQKKLGGNAPIFSRTAARLGQRVTCIGALGDGGISPVFSGLNGCDRLFSVAEPGESTALEFEDGKILLAMNADIDLLDYSRVEERMGESQLADSLNTADLVALLNWSELARGTDLWRGLLQKSQETVSAAQGKKMLVDLCDISRKSKKQIQELLELLRGFAACYQVLLSLNENEADRLGVHFGLQREEPLPFLEQLYDRLGLQNVVVHTIPYACGKGTEGAVLVPNQPVARPVLSTGAGDNFNGGLAVAWGHGLGLKDALEVANAVTGCYVSTGESPSLAQVMAVLENE